MIPEDVMLSEKSKPISKGFLTHGSIYVTFTEQHNSRTEKEPSVAGGDKEKGSGYYCRRTAQGSLVVMEGLSFLMTINYI